MPIVGHKQLNRHYKDIDLDMLVHPHTGDIVKREDQSAISGAILNIIKTKRGERVMDPDFGSNVYHSLFEPMSTITRITLEAQIENAINEQEPRATLQEVKVSADPDANGYNVTIIYIPLNENKIVELEFFLNRLR